MKRNLILYAICVLLAAGAASAQMTAQAGDFTLTFNGVQYSGDLAQGTGTSTWSYTLVWHKSVKNSNQLSHLTIGFCNLGSVLSSTPAASDVGTDGSTGTFGIKWESSAIPDSQLEDVPVTVTFTLDKPYAVGVVPFAAKAGVLGADDTGQIYGPLCELANPHLSIAKSCPGDVFVGDNVGYTVTVTNDGNVPLANVTLVDAPLGINENLGTLAPGASAVRNGSLAASAAGSITNTASASGDYFTYIVSDSDTCATTAWALSVSKTAVTHYDRDFDWTVIKSGDATAEICHGQTKPIAYNLDVHRATIDSNHGVDGTIVVFNPAPIPAPVASVSDQLSPGGTVAVNCGVSFPYALAPNSSLVCSYATALGDAGQRTNTGRAALSNGSVFEGSAAVVFGAPDHVSDGSITIADSVTCPAGFTCSAAGPFTFTDSGSVNFEINVTNDTALCNSYFDVQNTATWSDDGSARASGPVATSVYTCQCSQGCTLTIGYWKTHAGFTGRNPDNVTQYLPQWLGTPFAPSSVQITTAAQAVQALSMELGTSSNGITKLYAQLLAAKLNIARGASGADVAATIGQADAYLATHGFSAWATVSKAEKTKILTWMTLLDAFNNGDLGPGHCD